MKQFIDKANDNLLKEFAEILLTDLDSQLQLIRLENEDIIKAAELSIKALLSVIEKLKVFVLENDFKNEAEEINFFKNIKPHFISKLIYYNSIFKIETKKPHCREKNIRKYLNNELDKLKLFFDNNLEFYKYYRTNSTFLDDKLFLRDKYDIKLSLDTFYFQTDQTFSTSHDYKVAKIIANDLIQVYLEDQLYNSTQKVKKIASQKLKWTGSKSAMIELIYALYYQGIFDNGNSDIRLIAKYFEDTFNIDLGNFYQTYLELRTRKVNRTKFLDVLREGLIKKMDEQDEK